MTGVLLVDKPEGITSAAVVARVKRRLAGRPKVGHVGTLDPFASGLLPLCIGEATKVARYLSGERKTYEGTAALGTTTDTLDPTGRVTQAAPVPPYTAVDLDRVARELTGAREQEPPMYSAVKRDGIPLYRLARAGRDVPRAPRPIEIVSLRLWASGPDRVDFVVECSKGTYVRVLAADIGQALGTVAHLVRLRRTGVGALRLADAAALASLEAWPPDRPLPLRPIAEALGHLRHETLTPVEVRHLRQGRQEPLRHLDPAPPGTAALLVTGEPGGLVAAGVAETDQTGRWRIARLLSPDSEDQALHA